MKKAFFGIFLTPLFLISCSEDIPQTPQKYFETSFVQSGTLINSESFVGYVESFQSIGLAPKSGGKIVSLNKKVGERVFAGEVVGVLDSSEAKSGYSSSQDIISNLETLKKTTSSMFDSQILAMEEKISGIQTSIEIANLASSGTNTGLEDAKANVEKQLQTIETQIESAETGLKTAQLNLENNKNTLDKRKQDLYNNSQSAISQANILGANMIDFLDTIFGVTPENRHKNDSYEIYLGAKDSSSKNKVENKLQQFINNFKQAKELPLNSKEEIEIALNKYNTLFGEDGRELLKQSYRVFENTIDSSALPLSQINGFKEKTTQLQSQNEQLILSAEGNFILGLKGALDNIKNFEFEEKQNLDMLTQQVEMAQKQIDTLKSSKEQIITAGNAQVSDIHTKNDISKKQVELSQKGLLEAQAGIESLKKQKQASLSEIDTQISQVKSGRNEAGVMIENGKITSLIDGIITKKTAEVGQIISPGMPVYMISNEKDLKIEVGVFDEIVQNITIGDEVLMEIDGVSAQISGKIHNISPSKDPITKKTLIEIIPSEKNLTLGSYTKVYFNRENGEQNNGIIIPNQAIISKYMIPGVYIIKENTAHFVHIDILSQNNSFSQITGVEIGDEIILAGKENIYDGEVIR